MVCEGAFGRGRKLVDWIEEAGVWLQVVVIEDEDCDSRGTVEASKYLLLLELSEKDMQSSRLAGFRG